MTTRQRDLSEFNRPAVERGEGPDVFIELTGKRVPWFKRVRNGVAPKDLRWLDDDHLTQMEEAIYQVEV